MQIKRGSSVLRVTGNVATQAVQKLPAPFANRSFLFVNTFIQANLEEHKNNVNIYKNICLPGDYWGQPG